MMSYDLNLMNTAKEFSETPLTFDNNVCEGAYKLVQRILILLFKDEESALLANLGTNVLKLTAGNVYNEDDLQNHFNIAADKVRSVIQNTADEFEDPEDEQLDHLKVEVSINDADRSYMILNIIIETVSGKAINSTVPYKINGE